MNQVYYGNQAYGIEAAAQTYFSKPAKKLTLREAALLAGLPQAPSRVRPLHAPEKALARRNEVLRAMLDEGDITRRQYDCACASRELGLKPGKLYTHDPRAVLLQLRPRPADRRVRREHRPLAAGSRSTRRSTRASSAQREARSGRRCTTATDPAAALVSIDPRTARSAR